MENLSVCEGQHKGGLKRVGLAVLYAVVYMLSVYVTRHFELSMPFKVAVVLVPIPFFVIWILAEVRMIRRLDEMQRLIQLEALAIAFPSSIVFLMTLGLLQRVIHLPEQDWGYREVWPILLLFYVAALLIARRRYQ